MELSVDLISQFAKLTTEKEKPKSETTVYGVTVEYEGRMYVKFDGSDLLTPVLTTTDMVAGERVSVLLKNHTATVTGNLSSPSARTDDMKAVGSAVSELSSKISDFEIIIADKVTTEDLDAINGRIDTLVSDNVTVKQNLTAVEASIETLEADVESVNELLTASNADIENLKTNKLDATIANSKFATIESLNATNADLNNLESTYAAFEVATANRFTAAEGDISKLETDKLDAATAEITYAKIADLNATNADITNLEADVADLDTLIFGSATGDIIHSSFANAVVAQLSNAQIKSAMIESISASKIASGDIITNNVRVMSEDGSLIISDETIQIKDGTRVRVQIGKDASNNYSINIWDADGNLMFSEGGITDNAIKTAIIRNDMVSDTANIAAHKLDIDSLFEEINGSTKTIKSSKIYLDDKKQTLDVAFETMSTDLTELQNGVSTQGTQITAIQGQISSKVWQQDINTAISDVEGTTDNLSTQYEELVQEVEGLTATAASHTSTLATKADSTTVSEVNNKVTSLEANLTGFKSTVSDTYATKTALTSTDTKATNAQTAAANAQSDVDALETRVGSAETEISNNTEAINLRATKTEVATAKSEAISTASTDATTKANNAVSSANANTANLLKSYSTTTEMNAAIQLKADGITSSVSSTYATKTALETTNSNVNKANTAATNAQTAANNAQADIDGLEIGGRNLLKDTRFDGEAKRYDRLEGYSTEGGFYFEPTEQIESGVEHVLSLSMRGNANIVFYEINSSGGNFAHAWIRRTQLSETEFREFYLTFTVDSTRVFEKVFICTQYGEEATAVGDWFELQSCSVKLERGNRKTDWSPAPEDMATSGDISAVQKSIESTEERLTASETVIQQLSDSIIHLVTDGEGQSLMTQTEDGWTFSTKEIQDMVDATSEGLSGLVEEVGDVNSAVRILQQAVDDLEVLNDYVKITTYEEEPCIELGETDSDFKLLITNTRILFMEGNDIPAYITNRALHIKTAVIEEELQQGGFLWKSRSNGNLGLVWKGV